MIYISVHSINVVYPLEFLSVCILQCGFSVNGLHVVIGLMIQLISLTLFLMYLTYASSIRDESVFPLVYASEPYNTGHSSF